MADKPWSDHTLPKGMVVQRLESLGCSEVREHRPGHALWLAPTGRMFSISYGICDSKYLEGIAAQIAEWVDESNRSG